MRNVRTLLVAALAATVTTAGARAEDPPPAPPPAVEEKPTPAEEAKKVAPETVLEEVEVVATGYERKRGDSTVPISVIYAEWFEEHGVSSIAEGLRQVPGAAVSRGGTAGAATSLFLRGAASNQVLVLQDGIPLNDPTVGSQFNFFDLDALNLERVEVLRGSYGALYGNSAVGGVVNLVSRRGEGPASGRLSAEFGSFGTHRETLSAEGGDEDSDWSFGIAESGTDGPEERQAFRSVSLAGLFGWKVGSDGRGEVSLRWLDSTAEDPFDFGFGVPIPPDGNIRRERELAALGIGVEKPIAPWLEARVRASVMDADSAFRNGSDTPGGAAEFLSTAEATTTLLAASMRAAFPEDGRRGFCGGVVAGGDYRVEETLGFSESPFGSGQDVDSTIWNGGWYALADLSAGPVTLNGGARVDDHSGAGKEASPQAGARLEVEATRTSLRANYGEGFRAPTPAEFTDPFVGNPDLLPETSQSVDFGADQRLGDVAVLEFTWFRLRTEDLIAFNAATNLLENFARTETHGYEWGLVVDAGADVKVRASYTAQKPRDEVTNARLANRPDRFGSAGVEWTPGPFTLTADLYWQGTVADSGPHTPDAELRDHPGRRTVVNFGARWRASEAVTIFARIENATDAEYVETPLAPKGAPLAAFAGLSLEF